MYTEKNVVAEKVTMGLGHTHLCARNNFMEITIKNYKGLHRNTNKEYLSCPQKDDEDMSIAFDMTKLSRTTALMIDIKILEGSVLANLLKPAKQSLFKDYASTVFVSKLTKESWTVKCLNAVFDM